MNSKDKRPIYSMLHQFIIKLILDDFDAYLDSFGKHLKKIQDNFGKKVKAETNLMTDEEKESSQPFIEGEYERLGQTYPKIMRRSILLAIYSFCAYESDEKINKVEEHEIKEIGKIRDIRDLLAHHWGKLGNDPEYKRGRSEEIREYINRTPGISIGSSDEIIIEPEFIKRVINIFKKYFKV